MRFFIHLFILISLYQKFEIYAQEQTTKSSFGSDVNGIVNGAKQIAGAVGISIPGLGGGGSGAGGGGGMLIPHDVFPECLMMPTIPNVQGCEQLTAMLNGPTYDMAMMAIQMQVMNLTMIQKQYNDGSKYQHANAGEMGTGPMCLQSRLDQIKQSIADAQTSFNKQINDIKKLNKEMDEKISKEMEPLKADYDTLYTGKNGKYNIDLEFYGAKSPCGAIMKKDSMNSAYNGGGLMKVQAEAKPRTEAVREYKERKRDYESHINNVLRDLPNKLKNMTLDELLSSGSKGVGQRVSDESSSNIIGSKSFNDAIEGGLKNFRGIYEGKKAELSKTLGTSPADTHFMNRLFAGDGADKMTIVNNWISAKTLDCVYETHGTKDSASFMNYLKSKLVNTDGHVNKADFKSFQTYFNSNMSVFTYADEGKEGGSSVANFSTLQERIAAIRKRTSVNNSQVMRFNSRKGGASKSLAELLEDEVGNCQRSGMKIKEQAFYNVVNQKIIPYAKEIQKLEKNLRSDIRDRVEDKLKNCSGTSTENPYVTCAETNMSPNSTGTFCLKTADNCSKLINACQLKLDGTILQKQQDIKGRADKINLFVETLRKSYDTTQETMSKGFDLFLATSRKLLGKFGSFIDTTGLDFKKQTPLPIEGFDEIAKAPLGLKILSVTNLSQNIEGNYNKILQKLGELETKTESAIGDSIGKAKANYGLAAGEINTKLQSCMQLQAQAMQNKTNGENTAGEFCQNIDQLRHTACTDEVADLMETINIDAVKDSKIQTRLRSCKDEISWGKLEDADRICSYIGKSGRGNRLNTSELEAKFDAVKDACDEFEGDEDEDEVLPSTITNIEREITAISNPPTGLTTATAICDYIAIPNNKDQPTQAYFADAQIKCEKLTKAKDNLSKNSSTSKSSSKKAEKDIVRKFEKLTDAYIDGKTFPAVDETSCMSVMNQPGVSKNPKPSSRSSKPDKAGDDA